MTKQLAVKLLNIGYVIFGISTFSGFFMDNHSIVFPFIFGYIIWSTYWGYKLLYKKLKVRMGNYSKNTPVHISTDNVFDYFHKVHQYKWFIKLVAIFICHIVGMFGGGIYMQYTLSKIAYF